MTLTKALSSATRGMIIAHSGHRFMIGDFRQIESLLIAWQAGQQNVLDVFASGQDSYCVQASAIYNRLVTKKNNPEERQVGKICILAFGYQGGIGAMVKFAKTYGIDLNVLFRIIWPSATPDEKEKAEYSYMLYMKSCKKSGAPIAGKNEALVSDIMKQRYRASNPRIVEYWDDLEVTAIQAIKSGSPVKCKVITWFMSGPFLHCRLPSGRDMKYPFPRLIETQRAQQRARQFKNPGSYWEDDSDLGNGRPRRPKIEYMTEDAQTKEWRYESTYGGKLSENITQAIGRDCMTENMPELESKGYLCVLSSHDELVAEVPGSDEYSLVEFLEIMGRKPSWAADFPLEVEGFESKRYGKI